MTTADEITPVLHPITRTAPNAPTWDGAVWIGEVDVLTVTGGPMQLAGGQQFEHARLLIWAGDQPRGFVEVPVRAGWIDGGAVCEAADRLPALEPLPDRGAQPPISVVICTRDRPAHLARALSSLRALDYPRFEVVVVDNNPASGLTPPVVAAVTDLPIRLVDAVGQGLSVARNVGARHARHGILAYTDDDVTVDRRWLSHIAAGFARDERIACVCGMVPTSEVAAPAQAYFDRRVSWAQRWAPERYDLHDQLARDGLFPLRVSEFGTGANFAIRTEVLIRLGGFDEALGAGSPAGSGEDVDVFVRVLLAGHLLAREPAAVVWHSHRETVPELESQMYNYATGLTAWLVTLLMRPRTAWLVFRRLVTGARHLRQVTVVEHDDALAAEPALAHLRRHELWGALHGPWALIRGRAAGRRARPLHTRSSRLGQLFDARHGRMWGETDDVGVAVRRATAACAVGLVGMAGAVDALPSAVRAVAVLAAIAGPGYLLTSFYARLPRFAVVALVPVIGIAVCVLTVTGLLMVGLYAPHAVLVSLGVATVLGALVRLRHVSPARGAAS
ncbi:glycosyltransferase [Mycobacterium sp. djl-10]|nr:glycosyltransferase [Mycobacterium sp. djl-10]